MFCLLGANFSLRGCILFMIPFCASANCVSLNVDEKLDINLVYKVVLDERFGHELINREFWITKLPRMSVLVTLGRRCLFFANNPYIFVSSN
jgi:hypothetical protein